MPKVASLFMIHLLLFFMTFTTAARPEPAFHGDSPAKTQEGDVQTENFEIDVSCEGIGEDECLMRRTLTAHIDYIYTQKHKP